MYFKYQPCVLLSASFQAQLWHATLFVAKSHDTAWHSHKQVLVSFQEEEASWRDAYQLVEDEPDQYKVCQIKHLKPD